MGRIRYKCFLQSKKSGREKGGGIWPIFIAIPNLQKGERVLLEHCASIAQIYTTFYPFQIKGASGTLDRHIRRVIGWAFYLCNNPYEIQISLPLNTENLSDPA
jgi:hypothetical protein